MPEAREVVGPLSSPAAAFLLVSITDSVSADLKRVGSGEEIGMRRRRQLAPFRCLHAPPALSERKRLLPWLFRVKSLKHIQDQSQQNGAQARGFPSPRTALLGMVQVREQDVV